jgi:D-alanyl-D-alanine-carboxypeptidase/D-alanyl-D-alanine-endopeptidase
MRVMTLLLAIGLMAMAVPSIAAPTSQSAILAARTTTPGTVVELARVTRGGPVVYETAGKLDDGKSANEHTVFEIGSVTKTFTATILASMVLDGSVRLDDPVQKYLPPDVHMPQRNGKVITLLDLATHHSGLPRMPDNMHAQNLADPYAGYDKAQMYEFLNKLSLTRDPGALYEYSNLGASVLGTVLANRAGTDYATLLKQRVLDPLGMHETGVVLTADMTPRLAPGHTADGELATLWNFDAMAPAGAIRSTAADLTKFVRCQLGEGPLAKTCLFAQTPRTTISTTTHIGLIWMTGDITHITHHGGDVNGWHAGVALAQDRAVGVITLTNGDYPIDDVAMHWIDPSVPVDMPPAFHVAAIDPAKIDQYVGAFALNVGPSILPFVIERDGNRLYARQATQERIRIFPTDKPDEFEAPTVGTKLDFARDAAGKVIAFTAYQNGNVRYAVLAGAPPAPPPDRPIAAERMFPAVAALDDATLASYVGDYAAGDEVFAITRNAGELFSQLQGQPPIPIYASAKDAFFVKVVDAKITFDRDAQGKVTELVLHQSGRNIPFRRLAMLVQPETPAGVHQEVVVAPSVLADYVGTYRVPPVSNFVVKSEGGAVVATLGAQPSLRYFPESDTKFYNSGIQAELEFVRDGTTHAVTAVILHQGGNDFEAKRIAERKEIALAPAAIAELAGSYEMATKVVYPATGVTEARPAAIGTVTPQDGHLTFRFDDGPDVALYPESATTFFAKVLDGQLVFFRDPVTHAITRLVYTQSGHDRDGKKLP